MNRSVFIRLSLLLILVSAFSPPAWAGQVVTEDVKTWAKSALAREKKIQPTTDNNTVAVLYFRNQTGRGLYDPIEKGLALLLITDLSGIEKIRLVERVRLQALVEELNLGESGLVAPGSEPRVGKLLGAGFIVGGDLVKGGESRLRADARTVSVPRAQVIDQSLTEGELEELFRMEKELLFEIVKALDIELSEAEADALKKPISKNIKAVLSMFKGLSSSDRGDYARAADHYRAALALDPGLALARNALTELKDLGLIGRQPRARKLMQSIKGKTSLTDDLFDDKAVSRESPPGQEDTGDVVVEW